MKKEDDFLKFMTYEVASSWTWILPPFADKLVVKYTVWKTTRKYKRYQEFLKRKPNKQ